MVRLGRSGGQRVVNWPGDFETDQTHFVLPPSAWGVRKTRPRQLQILLNERAFVAVKEHAHATPGVAVCGVLLGRFCRDETREFVVIDAALRAHGALSEPAGVQVSHQGWIDMIKTWERDFPHLRVMGWYHTNPGLGIRFSSTDQATHRRVFFRKYHVGLIYDPATDECGIFCWTGSLEAEELRLSGRCGFYLYRPTAAFYDLLSALPGRAREAPGPTVAPQEGPPIAAGLVTRDGTLWNYERPSPREASAEPVVRREPSPLPKEHTPVPSTAGAACKAPAGARDRARRPPAIEQPDPPDPTAERRRDIETLGDCLGPGFEVRVPREREDGCVVDILLSPKTPPGSGTAGQPVKLAVLIPTDYPDERPKFHFDPPVSLQGTRAADGHVDVRRSWQNWRRRLQERQRGETRLNPIAEIVRKIARAADPQLPTSAGAGTKDSEAAPRRNHTSTP